MTLQFQYCIFAGSFHCQLADQHCSNLSTRAWQSGSPERLKAERSVSSLRTPNALLTLSGSRCLFTEIKLIGPHQKYWRLVHRRLVLTPTRTNKKKLSATNPPPDLISQSSNCRRALTQMKTCPSAEQVSANVSPSPPFIKSWGAERKLKVDRQKTRKITSTQAWHLVFYLRFSFYFPPDL